MTGFKEIPAEQLGINPFAAIGSEWMLITAQMGERVNAMTASWGGLGRMWNRNVAFTVIRPQRFTKTLVDGSDTFSLAFFGGGEKETLGYMGSASGWNEDKIAGSGLTVLHDGEIPYFAEARVVLLCKKLFAQPYRPESFIAEELNAEFYPKSDHHTLYISEILKVLVRE
jgi:flavin reductase (DIM6/NTAB) family NADH-FMN oxidoreductase RutF